jgi:hypothetical protein
MVPKAVRVAMLVNPANVSNTETTVHIVQEAAHTLGLQIEIVNATTTGSANMVLSNPRRHRSGWMRAQSMCGTPKPWARGYRPWPVFGNSRGRED